MGKISTAAIELGKPYLYGGPMFPGWMGCYLADTEENEYVREAGVGMILLGYSQISTDEQVKTGI